MLSKQLHVNAVINIRTLSLLGFYACELKKSEHITYSLIYNLNVSVRCPASAGNVTEM